MHESVFLSVVVREAAVLPDSDAFEQSWIGAIGRLIGRLARGSRWRAVPDRVPSPAIVPRRSKPIASSGSKVQPLVDQTSA